MMEAKSEATRLDLFQAILERSFDAIVIVDQDGKVIFWSQSAGKIFGYSEEEAIGTVIHDLITPEAQRAQSKANFRTYQTTGNIDLLGREIEVETVNKMGHRVWVDVNWNDVIIEKERWAFAIIRDARNRKLREMALERAATTDPLSGLANRREFQKLLEQSVDQTCAVAIIDVDQFKNINDRHGHLAGDQAIHFIARNLLMTFQDAVVVSRLGGDEFGVVVTNESSTDLIRNCEKARLAIEEGTFSDFRLRTSISIGIAFSKDGGTTARDLMTHADQALYASKKDGRNKVTLKLI